MMYTRLSDGLNKYKLIPETDDIWNHITDNNKDYYTGIFQYNAEQYAAWQKNNSVAGIRDVVTKKLVWDFDSAATPDLAKQDAIALLERLKQYGIDPNEAQITFSGAKGYGIEVDTDKTMSQDEFKTITSTLAKGLETYDTVVNDAQRIVRVVGTKHQKSNLFKTPLTIDQLKVKSTIEIKSIAKDLDNIDMDIVSSWGSISLPEAVYNLRIKPVEEKKIDVLVDGIDESKKPRFLDMPRWYLQNGMFGSGERNNAFLCLAATYKNIGFEKEHTYRLLKGVAEIQANRNNVERYSDKEIWNNIVSVVYSNFWQGGQFSLKDEGSWLHQYAKKYNIKIEETFSKPVSMFELGGASFTRYAESFYKTRIYTGLKDLDEAFPICAGSNVAIVGSASSGKTALSLNILRESNKQDAISVFASLDMSKSRLYEKMLYSVTDGKLSRDELYQAYIDGSGSKYDNMVKEVFPNTYVFSKSSPTVEQLKNYLESVQDHTGKPVRLLMVDYFERLGSEKSDDTAASKDVAGGIQDLISDFPELTPITLYQPNKFSLGGGPDKPILSYTAIKGSSFVYQAARQILALWRPMFTPELSKNDKFMEMAILKNDLGELGKFCYNWKGKTGEISPMSDYDRTEYDTCMKEKEQLENKNKFADSI